MTGSREEVLVMSGTIPEILMQVGRSYGAGETTASRVGYIIHLRLRKSRLAEGKQEEVVIMNECQNPKERQNRKIKHSSVRLGFFLFVF